MKRIILVALLASGSTASAMDLRQHFAAEIIGYTIAYLLDRVFVHPHRYNAPEQAPRANAQAPAHAAPAPAAQPARNVHAPFGGHVQRQTANCNNGPNPAHVQAKSHKKALLTIGTIGIVAIIIGAILVNESHKKKTPQPQSA